MIERMVRRNGTIFILIMLLFSVIPLPVLAEEYSSSIKIVAVDNHDKGVVGSLSIEIKSGSGRTLVDTTHVLTGFYTQDSEKTAVKVVEDRYGFDFSKYDVIFTIRSPGAAMVDGPSAGAAMTVALVAAIEGKEVPDEFAMTGTIQEDGSIGPVGGIFAKAEAAAKSGVTLFLIPKGQSIQYRMVRETKRLAPGWVIETVRYVPVNVTEYAEKNWGMRIEEVSDIDEAVKYALSEEIPSPKNVSLPSFTPTEEYKKFKKIAENEIKRAEENIRDAKQSSIEEISFLVSEAEKNLNSARKVLDKNYYYTSTNYAFRASVDARTAKLLSDYYSSSEEGFVTSRISELENNISTMEIKNKNSEWAVLAEERIIYAENILSSIDERDEIEDQLRSIATAEEWIYAAEKLASNAKTSEEFSVNLREEAEKWLHEEGDSWYKDAARKEFERGYYLASICDSITAKIESEPMDYGMEEILDEYEKKKDFRPNNLISEMKFEYSQFLYYSAKTRNDAAEALRNLLIARKISEEFDSIRAKKNKIGLSPDGGTLLGIIAILTMALILLRRKSKNI
ncbi:MAG: S16 family serine protease [Candidatus Syntropharchaeia archaeon]